MQDNGYLQATHASPALAGHVQTTIVTLDRGWGNSLAQELRSNNIPTLMPASPARWREQFCGSELNCIIFDLDHGGVGALEAMTEIATTSVMSMIVAAATAPTIKTVVGAVRAGAFDFVNKRFHVREVREQIQDAGRQLIGRQKVTLESNGHRDRIQALTPREREIIAAIASGLSTKQIAHNMGITPRTVQMFRDRIKKRLQARSVEEALSIWMQFADRPKLHLAA